MMLHKLTWLVWQIDAEDGPLAPWLNGNWRQAMFDPLRELIGEPLLGAFFAVPILVGFYVAGDGSLAAPSVLVIIMGAIMLPVLPGDLAGIAYGVAFFGILAAVVSIGWTWVVD